MQFFHSIRYGVYKYFAADLYIPICIYISSAHEKGHVSRFDGHSKNRGRGGKLENPKIMLALKLLNGKSKKSRVQTLLRVANNYSSQQKLSLQRNCDTSGNLKQAFLYPSLPIPYSIQGQLDFMCPDTHSLILIIIDGTRSFI